MVNISKIKAEITRYTIIAAVIAEVVSVPIFGLKILFPYGLAIGVCVALVNLHIIGATVERAVASGRQRPVVAGFVIRLTLYGGAFWLTVSTSGVSGLGAAIGFLLPRIAMYIHYGIRPWLRRKLGKEPPAAYVADTRSNIFISEPWLVRYSKGKVFMTHRHYRKRKIVQEEGKGK